MTRRLHHPLLGLILSIALIALNVLAGAAETRVVSHGPLTDIVICAGEGTMTIVVDATGQPVQPDAAHPCAKCLPSFAATVPASAEVPAPMTAGVQCEPAEGATAVTAFSVTLRARGPPVAKV